MYNEKRQSFEDCRFFTFIKNFFSVSVLQDKKVEEKPHIPDVRATIGLSLQDHREQGLV
jgi:hypothetical protein